VSNAVDVIFHDDSMEIFYFCFKPQIRDLG
jgi:hypothetical protein